MKISQAYPTKFLSAADIEDLEGPVVMGEVVMEDMNDGSRKPVLYFQNLDKGLVLNKTNGNTISAVYGDDTDEWAGHKVQLISVPVEFQGKMVDGIRVRAKQQKQSQPKPAAYGEAKARVSSGKPMEEGSKEMIDDDLPF